MRSTLRILLLLLTATVGATLTCAPVWGATNVATGSFGDGSTLLEGGDGTGTATFTLESTRLALHKQARREDGSVLGDDADVLVGQTIWFVLWIDNPTDYETAGLTLVDQLNESEFTYVPGTLAATTASSAVDDATLWAGTWQALDDPPDPGGDEASFVDNEPAAGADRLTVGDVAGQANRALTIAPRSRYAVRFKVTVN